MVVRRASPRVLTELDPFRVRVRSEMMVLKKVPAERLRSVTIIVAAHLVKLTDDASALVAADMANFETDFRNCLMGHLTRGVRVVGVFEIDIVTPKLMTAGKRALLRDVNVEEIAADEQVIIVHIHMLMDCRGYDSPEALGRDLRKQFPGPRRIVVQELHADKSVSQNIENLAGYFTKHIRAYSNAYDADGRKVKFTTNFDREWAAWLDRLYRAISLDGTVYSTTSSRAGQKFECKHPEAKTLMTQGFSTIPSEDQLRHKEEHRSDTKSTLEETLEHSSSTNQDMARIIRQRIKVIAEQCAEPFDDQKPMVFYMMKRIMQEPSIHRFQGILSSKTDPDRVFLFA